MLITVKKIDRGVIKMTEKKKFWFVVGSQELYGEEALIKVKENAENMVKTLNESGNLPYPVELHDELAINSDIITNIMKTVNYRDDIQGVITWMHTFSPAKLWIRGTALLQKPLLHLATQYYEGIPWETIDMDYMNLYQSAHGDREYGYINKRLQKNNQIVVGFWKDQDTQKQISDWMKVAHSFNESFNIKVARFGDNMRNVAVTEGDKIEAQIKLGWTVDYFGIGDLVEEIEKVSSHEVSEMYKEYQNLYDLEYGDNDEEAFDASVKEQIKYEIAIQKFLDRGGYTAFTTNFEDLHNMKQLPGLAVQRLNGKGYGFAGEGDWKTAALDRLLKIMSDNESTGFMEDYTYDMRKGHEQTLGSHMLEVDPTFSASKPKIVVHPLGIGGKDDPARMVFDGKSGDGVVSSISDMGESFKMIINKVSASTPTEEAPHLPVARVIWETKPNFKEGIEKWIQAGGGHHTVLSLSLNVEHMKMLAEMMGLDYTIIE